MSRAAHTDDLAPIATGGVDTYPTAAAGPTRSALLVDGDTVLGRIWTDGQAAAGFLPDTAAPPAALALASRATFRILANLHRRGIPAAEVLNAARWAPLYRLGDPTTD